MSDALASTPGVAATSSPRAGDAGAFVASSPRARGGVAHTGARWEVVAPLLLAIAAAAGVVAAIEPWPVGVFQDDGIYAVLAKSLATGEGYRFIQMPGAPNATHYPPGYPLLLAALWKLYPQFPANVTLFKFANAFLLGVTAAFSWRLARRAGLSLPAAAAAVLLFTTCTPVILLSVMVLSEPMFMAVLLPTLLLAEPLAGSAGGPDGTARRRVAPAFAAGVAIGTLAMVRTLGALVLPALVLPLVLQRRWRESLAAVAGAAIFLVPWQLWVAAHAAEVPAVFLGKYGSYTGWLVDAVRTEGVPWLLDVARHNAGKLLYETWTHTSTILAPLPVRVAATSLLGLLLLPGVGVALRRLPVTTLFAGAYMLVVVIWPFAPARFVWGIWPVVGILLALGTQWWWHRAKALPRGQGRLAPLGVGGVTAALVAGYLWFNVQSTREGWWTQVQGSVAMRARPMAQWVREHTRPGDVLATDDDLLVHLYTGRRTVPNGRFTAQEHLVGQTPAFAVESLREVLRTYHVDYVLANTEYATYAVRGLVGATPAGLRIVAGLERGAVFAPVPPSP